MASLSVHSFRHSCASPDWGLPAADDSWEVVESHRDGEEDAAAGDVDNGDEPAYSLVTESPLYAAPAPKRVSSSDWVMLASIGSMFPDDTTSSRAQQHHAGRTQAQEWRRGGPQSTLEKEALMHLYRRVEARRGRCRALFPEPLAIPADSQRWAAQQEALQRQRERRADADSLRVLEYWTARQERDGRLGGHSDAASLRRLEYWTERLRRGGNPEPRPGLAWKPSRTCDNIA